MINMAITFGQYKFEGPYDNFSDLFYLSGVYIILDKRNEGYFIIDIGESNEIRTSIEDEVKLSKWNTVREGKLEVVVLYMQNKHKASRQMIVRDLRAGFKPLCE